MKVRIKRVYEAPEKADGTRILVDRLWPRGLTKKKAAVDVWLKEVAPSDTLRRSFAHKPERWAQFRKRYFAELERNPEAVAKLKREIGRSRATLLYAAKNEERNNARALLEYLEK